MNSDYILYNLKEAHEVLTEIINEAENGEELNIGTYIVDMQHLFHHINTAWNSRDASEKETTDCSQQNFEKWRLFPDDLEMEL